MFKLKEYIKFYSEAILNTYAQLFFSADKVFAVFIILATFVDVYTGLFGLAALLFTFLIAQVLGFAKENIHNGVYGFNSLLIGLALGGFYDASLAFFFLLFLACLFGFLLTIGISGFQSRFGVPFLSLPFLIAIWVTLLAIREYDIFQFSDRGVFLINDLQALGGQTLVDFYSKAVDFPLYPVVEVYLKSLAAILFQYNMVSGLLVVVGLLYFSRISFLLSVAGFAAGYLFYYMLEGNINQLHYTYIGFNFILTSMALGGFFLVSNTYAFIFVVLLTPIVALLISAVAGVLAPYQLPVYSLPFNIVVILSIYILYFRTRFDKLKTPAFQWYSPEKNLYRHLNHKERFRHSGNYHLALPFFGEWTVSQAYAGEPTHKGEWKEALDFVITDDDNQTFRMPGTAVENFYCYNLPVLAPADGYVSFAEDHVDDNEIGKVNLDSNWGNSLVIYHAPYLYTQISHIRKGSFKVKTGDYVRKGDIIALNGNSGRSPEPHIHFQVQAAPYVGSKTLAYPLAYYISNNEGNYQFHAFSVPVKGQKVSNVQATSLMQEAFAFIPGKELRFAYTDQNGRNETVVFEIFTDAWNYTYLYHRKRDEIVYFVNNGVLHYCTSFAGTKRSPLYYFYLATQKVLLGFYKNIELTDIIPIDEVHPKWVMMVQDVFAPFYSFLKTEYKIRHTEVDDLLHTGKIKMEGNINATAFGKSSKKIEFEIELSSNLIKHISLKDGNRKIEFEAIA